MFCLRPVANVKFDIAPTGGDCASFPLSDILWVSKVHTPDAGEQRRVDAFDTKQVEKLGSLEVLLKTHRMNDKSREI